MQEINYRGESDRVAVFDDKEIFDDEGRGGRRRGRLQDFLTLTATAQYLWTVIGVHSRQ